MSDWFMAKALLPTLLACLITGCSASNVARKIVPDLSGNDLPAQWEPEDDAASAAEGSSKKTERRGIDFDFATGKSVDPEGGKGQ